MNEWGGERGAWRCCTHCLELQIKSTHITFFACWEPYLLFRVCNNIHNIIIVVQHKWKWKQNIMMIISLLISSPAVKRHNFHVRVYLIFILTHLLPQYNIFTWRQLSLFIEMECVNVIICQVKYLPLWAILRKKLSLISQYNQSE